MPRAHTPEERARIEGALIEAGRARFVRQGLARTTIAELARDAGIGKGSFYQFHESKESLFFAIHEREEAACEAELDAALADCGDGRAAVQTLLLAVAERLERHPFLRLLASPDTIASLMVRLPPEQVAAHREADRQRYLALARAWQARGWLREELDPEDFFAVLTSTFILSLQRELMGESSYRRAARAIALAMAETWAP